MANPDAKPLLAYITAPDHALATSLGRSLVEAGLCAGVNIAGPVQSIYLWQGKIREGQEWLLFCQTSSKAFPGLMDFVRNRHPHTVPCIISLEIASGNPPFLAWIQDAICKSP